MMDKLQRIGISIEPDLLSVFDQLIKEQGYACRSEAVRDLIRDKISQKELTSPGSNAVAAVIVIYDHHKPHLTEKLIELQHDHLLTSISSMHVHLDHHKCLEIILLKGTVARIRKLSNAIVSLKGVSFGKVNLISVNS